MNQPNKQTNQQQPHQGSAKRQSALQQKKCINQQQELGLDQIFDKIMTMYILINDKWREFQRKFHVLKMVKYLFKFQKKEYSKGYQNSTIQSKC
ncbi:unnamed protein product [Paramecium sonneborni]|uniref:Uncharacterized protein n=1 Tax=Paramecium sonneborni TaxID=65129 RepID=A0A8S1M757_9CILI|nr:unnamed protein product [Paramecium sonneborni]